MINLNNANNQNDRNLRVRGCNKPEYSNKNDYSPLVKKKKRKNVTFKQKSSSSD